MTLDRELKRLTDLEAKEEVNKSKILQELKDCNERIKRIRKAHDALRSDHDKRQISKRAPKLLGQSNPAMGPR